MINNFRQPTLGQRPVTVSFSFKIKRTKIQEFSSMGTKVYRDNSPKAKRENTGVYLKNTTSFIIKYKYAMAFNLDLTLEEINILQERSRKLKMSINQYIHSVLFPKPAKKSKNRGNGTSTIHA